MISRRHFNKAAALTMFAAIDPGSRAGATPATNAKFRQELAEIETETGGRLGVALLDPSSGFNTGHRESERFPLCSTFKFLAAAAVLKECDDGRSQLDRRVRFGAGDLVPNSPITQERVGGDGMTLDEICAAAMDYSDNTAGNLLLKQIGGPAGLTQYARSLGDNLTRLDRMEVDLNEALPGDLRDTTTPNAMLLNLQSLLLGNALSSDSRGRLTDWMRSNTTGGLRLKAGLPTNWIIGDKTGSGEYGSTNDIAIIWPPQRPPLLLTVYLTGTVASAAKRNAALAAVGRATASVIQSM